MDFVKLYSLYHLTLVIFFLNSYKCLNCEFELGAEIFMLHI